MIMIENECVDCGLPCMRESCPYYKVVRFYCDCCHDEVEDLYWFDGEELCIDCVAKRLEKIEYND